MKNKTTDETPLEFFANLQIPANWRFVKEHNLTNSYGKIYEIDNLIFIRIYFFLVTCKGGILQKNMRVKPFVYEVKIDNKTSDFLNEFIKTNYGING